MRNTLSVLASSAVLYLWYRYLPFPSPGANPVLDLVGYHSPLIYEALAFWHYAAPSSLLFFSLQLLFSAWRLWMEPPKGASHFRSRLPPWPLSPIDPAPALVVGEQHHPVQAREIDRPTWLTIPERGLYTGIFIVGAVGSGKTTAAIHPFAEQLLNWQAEDSQRRAAALTLEVKGDFCHHVRQILTDANRGDDYIELALGGPWQWNPLAVSALSSYSLAFTLATLQTQLEGKSNEPFWQAAARNLIMRIIDVHRVLPTAWVTLQDIYRCAIDLELLERKIEQANQLATQQDDTSTLLIAGRDFYQARQVLRSWEWSPRDKEQLAARFDPDLQDTLTKLGLPFSIDSPEDPSSSLRQTIESIAFWYYKHWLTLDLKLRSSIVEGLSVFLSIFDQPEVAAVFCPAAPPAHSSQPTAPVPDLTAASAVTLKRYLPPLDELIETGKVLCLNMPTGADPALSRIIGVLLKNSWLRTLLQRPAAMQQHPNRYFRPAVFVCDEYQSFATVGEDDPSGDERSFALTRQCRVVPIVATQSISSLRSVLRGGDATWRTLLQTLRTRLFLSLSDDASAETASHLCGTVPRMKSSFAITENTNRSEMSPLTGRPGGSQSSLGVSKSFREAREPLFHPRDFSLLPNYQAICLPYDGKQTLPAQRVYLKPHYLPKQQSYWRQKEEGLI